MNGKGMKISQTIPLPFIPPACAPPVLVDCFAAAFFPFHAVAVVLRFPIS
jgi:hypothetical protein